MLLVILRWKNSNTNIKRRYICREKLDSINQNFVSLPLSDAEETVLYLVFIVISAGEAIHQDSYEVWKCFAATRSSNHLFSNLWNEFTYRNLVN